MKEKEIKFITKVECPKVDPAFKHTETALFIGSCFSENIGLKLTTLKYNLSLNPSGILYNPRSIACTLWSIINKKKYAKSDLSIKEDLYFSYDHHGKFRSTDPEELINLINFEFDNAHVVLKKASHLFITFGSAFVYRLKENNKPVANCHKMPADLFNRELLTIENIFKEYAELIQQLNKVNKKIKIIFTVSPIRHWKDGATENLLSKSILFIAINKLKKEFKNVSYFPAYEIFNG